jgi:hypothetical protein
MKLEMSRARCPHRPQPKAQVPRPRAGLDLGERDVERYLGPHPQYD